MTALSRLPVAIAGVALCVVGVAACSDPLGPSDVTGTYVVTDLESLITRDHRVVADTIFLYPDGTGSHRQHLEVYEPSPAQTRFLQSDTWITYEIRRAKLITQRTCGGQDCLDAMLVPPVTYVITADGLITAGGRLRYDRR